MLEFGDIITLENDINYVVAGICTYDNKFYAYVVNENDATECALGVIENDDFISIEDEETFNKIMPLILENVDIDMLDIGDENE